MRGALEQAAQDSAFLAENVIGIGVDTTGSNPLPVEGRNVPLDLHEQWKDHLDGAMLVMERSIPAPVKRTASPAWRQTPTALHGQGRQHPFFRVVQEQDLALPGTSRQGCSTHWKSTR